jgi:phosphoglycolate phosphatase-like HAD superfamily hydrolase
MTRGEDAEAFVRAFYQHRTRMRDNDFAAWMALQRPFPGVAEEIERLRREVSAVTIATTKDAPSARRLLESIGISGVPIFGREVSLDKADHMRAMAAQYQVGTKDIVFVDDLLENLLPLRELGVRLVLAGWGYNTSAERARAAAVGVAVAPLNGLADTVLDVLAA